MASRRRPESKRQPRADFRRDAAAKYAARGWSTRRIALHLDVAETTVSTWLSEPDVRVTIDKIREGAIDDARRTLQAAATDAADTLVEFSRGDYPDKGAIVQFKAACAVLDRVGLPATKQLIHEDASGLSDEELQRIAVEALTRSKGNGGAPPAATAS